MKFYIQDPTTNKPVYFNQVNEVVTYLESLVQKAHKLTRKQYMQNLVDLGYGYDDATGITFTRALSEDFNIGILSKDGTHVKTDIHAAMSFLKEEYGD